MATYDYYVSAVSYNVEETHISKLKVHRVNPNGGFNENAHDVLTRPQVVDLIAKKKTFSTITKTRDGWSMGAKLEIIAVSTDYVKTVRDSSAKDNLENLPKF